jgi:3-oxoacyl-[acyl-carrier protein] reductase
MKKNSNTLHRPVAIVTGGLQGLGLGIAKQLASDGFDIAVVDLSKDVESCTEKLTTLQDNGAQYRYYSLDISAIEDHASVLNNINADFGRIDCLVNNAGIAARPLTDILNLGPEAFDRSLDVNLRGTFFLSQAFANLLIKTGQTGSDVYRSIVIITSIAAEMVSTDRAQYCISKAALSMVSKLMAARLAQHQIHVHEVRPGFMQTDMTASAGKSVIDEWMADGRVPLARWGQPADVGHAVSSLASGHMPYMTGQPIWIAGGLNISRAT